MSRAAVRRGRHCSRLDTASQPGPAGWRWTAVAAYRAALVSTVIVEVPINLARGPLGSRPTREDGKSTRNQ